MTESPREPADRPPTEAPDRSDSTSTVARETVEATKVRPSGIAQRSVLGLITAYRRLISPLLGPRCRYYPSCSSYAQQAVSELGAIRGSVVAVWRVMRCNPLSSGGFDHLEDRKLFRRSPLRKPSATAPEVTQP